MSANYNDAVVTTRGVDLINAAIAQEKPIIFTKVSIGNGHWNSYTDLTTATALISPKNNYTIVSKVANGNQYKLKTLISNYDPDTGESVIDESYNINEVGIFAKLDTDGTEILYAIITAETTGDVINAYDGTNPTQIIFSYVTNISTDAQVTLELTGAYLLAEDFEDYKTEAESTYQAQHITHTISLAVADWDITTMQQTVVVGDVTASNTIIVSPSPSTHNEYCAAGIRAISQATGTVTFTCDGIPESDVNANIVILS